MPVNENPGMPPVNNFRPGTGPARVPSQNQNIEKNVPHITSTPLPALPPLRHTNHKAPPPQEPELNDLEKMHLEIRIRQKEAGEPDYINLKSSLDLMEAGEIERPPSNRKG